jgi:enamine deaminase RidA (YjgF/YER057c/UK114 family)
VTSPHEIFNPEELAKPVGFSHAVAASPGRTVFLGGQAAHDVDGKIVGATIVEQFAQAGANVVAALAAVGGKPEHLVSMQIFVTDAPAYRAALPELATVYAENFGRHYPAIAFFEVTKLFDPEATVELVCTAVIPES